MNFVEVALSTPLRSTFTYKNTENLSLIGKRVIVEFGRRQLIGVVIDENVRVKKDIKVKNIEEVLDYEPVLSPHTISRAKIISDYYFHPIGEVIFTFLPTLLRKKKKLVDLDKYKKDYSLEKLAKPKLPKLTESQSVCYEQISVSNQEEFLLFGVTSSGKTEIYKHIIKDYLAKGKSVLVLVPEIFLTPQIFKSLKKAFSDYVEIFHSGLTEIQRYKVWLDACSDSPKVYVGTRSAIFLPIKNLGLAIFDEEHDQSYKQNEGLRYDSKKIIKLIYEKGTKLLLSSATPSLQNLKRAQEKEIDSFVLKTRYGDFKHPEFKIISIQKKRLINGISDDLVKEISHTLKQGNQALVLLNRRGYAPIFFCESCGWIAKSSCCDSELVLHRLDKRLRCHRCGTSWSLPKECPNCKSQSFDFRGVGTQQLEEKLSLNFPNIPVVRIDRDSISSKARRIKSNIQIHKKDPKIFIGTQLLAKGHDFKNLSTIIVLNLDFGFFGADLHMQEQTAQLLMQVAGRAGRRGNESKVFLQTRLPDHPLLKKFIGSDYEDVAKSMLSERKALSLSPYVNQVYLKAEDANAERLKKFLVSAKNTIASRDVETYGPFEGPIQKQSYKYRMFCIVQSQNRKLLTSSISDFVNEAEKNKRSISSWSLDIDPGNAT
tara:strand:+ start:37108 stop:39075 length:1968 start_codon:yes stop_codon:yes gene_type:complete